MAVQGKHRRLVGVLEHGVALALGMSATFLLLLGASTPLVATAVVLPASTGLGLVRARLMPHPEPHCAVPPAFMPLVVVSAPKAAMLAHAGGASSAA